MKKTVSIACLLLVSQASLALPITDVVDVNNWFDDFLETESWTHDISDDITVGSDVVNSASLAFNFYDDERDGTGFLGLQGYEIATIIVNLIDFQDGGVFEVDAGIFGG